MAITGIRLEKIYTIRYTVTRKQLLEWMLNQASMEIPNYQLQGIEPEVVIRGEFEKDTLEFILKYRKEESR